ncbi:hypothetical protein GCM10020219_090420 [Nonomuraea dietziae]
MMGVASNHRPNAFWQADVDEAAALLVKVVREVRPQVMVTYDDNGSTAIPTTFQAHRVALRAFELAADPEHGEGEPWRVAKFYYTAVPRSVMRRTAEELAEAEVAFVPENVEDVPFGAVDDEITTEVDASRYLGNKLDAMRAHATQIMVTTRRGSRCPTTSGRRRSGWSTSFCAAGRAARQGPSVPREAGGLGEPYTLEKDLFAGIH